MGVHEGSVGTALDAIWRRQQRLIPVAG